MYFKKGTYQVTGFPSNFKNMLPFKKIWGSLQLIPPTSINENFEPSLPPANAEVNFSPIG